MAEPNGLTKSQPAVMATKPARIPFNVNENDRNGTYEISMKIHVPSNMELDKVISQLKTLRHVMRVNRV